MRVSGITWFTAFCVWCLPLSKLFSWFTHVVACASGLFLFYGWIAFHCISTPYFFIHPSGDGCMGCFHLSAILNSAVMNIHAQIFVWVPLLSVFKLLNWSHDTYAFFKKRISYCKLKPSPCPGAALTPPHSLPEIPPGNPVFSSSQKWPARCHSPPSSGAAFKAGRPAPLCLPEGPWKTGRRQVVSSQKCPVLICFS